MSQEFSTGKEAAFTHQVLFRIDQDVGKARDCLAPRTTDLRCHCVAEDLPDGHHQVLVHNPVVCGKHRQRAVPVGDVLHGGTQRSEVVNVGGKCNHSMRQCSRLRLRLLVGLVEEREDFRVALDSRLG